LTRNLPNNKQKRKKEERETKINTLNIGSK